jgi:hypothetical protein
LPLLFAGLAVFARLPLTFLAQLAGSFGDRALFAV